MNHVYRLTWNDSQQRYVPTQETARGRHKGGGAKRKLISAAVAATLLGGASGVLAAPTGGQVSSGSASLTQNGAVLTINQSSKMVALNWQSFNIAANETVNFVQPSATAVALNRVVGSDPSAIYGKLNANGQVFLLNANGILFGKSAEVNVGALVASTLNLSDADFAAGQHTFRASGYSGAGVTNLGRMVADGGYIALLGAQVSNQGTLQANLGTVALAAGQQTTLDFAGDKLISVAVERGALQALAENRQLVQADGGTVILTASAADHLVSAVVNNSGLIQARTLEQHAGVISLMGDMHSGHVKVGGTLDASAPNGGDGGFIETSGATVKVADDARITTAAPHGRTGNWLIDPHDYTVAASGGDISGATLSANLANTSVMLQSSEGVGAGTGDVNVRDAVSWNANTTLTLTASNNVNVSAPISAGGAAAGLVISPNTVNGGEAASGTGRFNLQLGAVISLPNVAPESRTALVIGGVPYTVINSLGMTGDSTALSLQGIGGDLAGHYALGSNIDATNTANWNGHAGFAPIGNSNSVFSGTFDGLGHTIGGLTINRPSTDYIGLFGQVGSSGVVRNVGLAGGSVTGHAYVGPLAGWNDGVLSSVNAATGIAGSSQLGGVAGVNAGELVQAYASGGVVGNSGEIGGLAGANYGRIETAYATGSVNGTSSVGGLIGSNAGTIRYAYATGTTAGTNFVGGLVGFNTGAASATYAIGNVVGNSNVGALVGRNSGTLSAGYWSSNVKATGIGAGSTVGAVGLTAAQMGVAANFAGFNFNAIAPAAPGWFMVDIDGSINNAGGVAGGTTPMLSAEYATTIGNAHQLQLMAVAPSAKYTLGANIDATGTGSGKDVWGGKGFVSVGNLDMPFSGSLDGMNQTISALAINAGSASYAGLFGNLHLGVVQNLGLVGGSISGGQNTGALAGKSDGVIRNAYATANVSGTNIVGGLVGFNAGTIENAYATGNVSGSVLVGGLIGKNDGTASAVYAAGRVSGTASGGLVGGSSVGTLTGAFWNSDVNAIGVGSGAADGAVGLSAAEMQTQANFSAPTSANGNLNPAWDFQSTWMSYEGHTAPLLRAFLTPLTVRANSASKTYDGLAYAPSGVTYSATPGSELLGTVNYGGSAQGASNAGIYEIVPGGLYSTQQGYAIAYGNALLMIKPATLTVQGTVVANKVYDGSAAASLSGGSLRGVIAGDSVTLTQSGLFDRKDVNAGIGVTATDLLGGSSAGNYIVAQPGGLSASITTKQLTVDGTAAGAKVYDGSRDAVLSGGALAGLVAGDAVRLTQSGTFASKDVGSAIVVQASAGLTGRDAGNYTVLAPVGLSADITAKQLTVRGAAVGNKVYDGSAGTSVNGGSISGVIGGDSVTFSQSGSFADKNVGKAKPLVYTNELTGADRGNYTLSAAGGTTTANIVAKDLTVLGTTAANKVYDGNTTATMSATLSGLVTGDTASLVQSGTFADKNVGVNKVVKYKNSLAGQDAGNYNLSSAGGTTAATLVAKALTVAGSTVVTKVYDSSTKAVVTGGALVGVVGTEGVRLRQSGAFVTKNAGTAIGVVAMDSLSGTAAGNYTLVQPTGLTGTISQKQVSASAPLATKKVYDATTQVELKNGRIGGVILGDAVDLVQTGAFVDKNVGNAKVVSYSNSLTGSDAGNYRLKLTGGIVKATISALQLSVDGYTMAADKVFDGTTAATVSGGLIDGVLAHDNVTFAQVGKFSSKKIGTQNVVYKNSLGGRDAANYTLSEKGGTTTAEITE